MAMQTYYPTAGNPYLNERWIVVLTITDPLAPKLATEIDAATSLDISCAIADWYPEQAQATAAGRRRACDPAALPKLQAAEYTLPELEYIFRPSLIDSHADNKAVATLTPGLEVFLVHRPDVDQATAFAVGQYVDVYKVRLGTQRRGRSDSNNENGTEYTIRQSLELLKTPDMHKLVVT